MTQTRQILEDLLLKSPDFYDEFQYVDRNIKGFFFFLLSYLVCSQNLAKSFCEWWPLWLYHKFLKRNPWYNMSRMCATQWKSYAWRFVDVVAPVTGKKGCWRGNYCSHVISVPMILVGQHAFISIRKLVHLPIKT
jgi:hypothetical protein